jgi:hypothetical protein
LFFVPSLGIQKGNKKQPQEIFFFRKISVGSKKKNSGIKFLASSGSAFVKRLAPSGRARVLRRSRIMIEIFTNRPCFAQRLAR